MNKAGWVLAFLGFTAVIALIAYYGGGEVLDAMALAGFWGLFWVSAFHVFPLIADVLAWAHVFRPTDRPRTFTLTWTRWVAESVNKLLPVAQLGGEFVRARLISQAGVRGPVGGATVVVDMTIGVFTQVIFSLMGVAALYLVADAGESRNLGQGLLFGLGVFFAVVRRVLCRPALRALPGARAGARKSRGRARVYGPLRWSGRAR